MLALYSPRIVEEVLKNKSKSHLERREKPKRIEQTDTDGGRRSGGGGGGVEGGSGALVRCPNRTDRGESLGA